MDTYFSYFERIRNKGYTLSDEKEQKIRELFNGKYERLREEEEVTEKYESLVNEISHVLFESLRKEQEYLRKVEIQTEREILGEDLYNEIYKDMSKQKAEEMMKKRLLFTGDRKR